MANDGGRPEHFPLTPEESKRQALLLGYAKVLRDGKVLEIDFPPTHPQILRALRKLKEGTGSMCDGCEDEIPATRLELVPSANCCAACQNEHDRLKS